MADRSGRGNGSMTQTFSKRLQTWTLTLLVTLLSVVFVLQFGGPQAQGCTSGGARYAARVYGTVITTGDFEAAYRVGNFHRQPLAEQKRLHLRELVLDGLIERTLLARKARELGFSADAKEVMKRLLERGTVFLSLGVDAPGYLPQGEIPINGGEGMDEQTAKRFIQFGLRRSISEFTEAQIEETLADRMRKVVTSGVTVSPRELWNEFVRRNDKARIEYVRFRPRYYEGLVAAPEPEALQQWMAAHQKEVDQAYQQRKSRYTNLPHQVRARHILIRVEEGADEAKKAERRKLAEQLLARARAGEDFAELARRYSEDPGSRARGGDLGWTDGKNMVEPFRKAMMALKPGQISDIVETRFGFHIIRVEAEREGDVPVEQAKREIAEELWRREQAERLAERDAKETLQVMRGESGLDKEALQAWLAEHTGHETQGEQASEDDPLAPRLSDSGLFGRDGSPIPGLQAQPIVQLVFEQDAKEPDAPMRLGGDFVVFRVVERKRATREQFTDEAREQLLSQMLPAKQRDVLRLYVHELRRRAEEEGAVRVHPDVIGYDEDNS